MLTTVIGSLQVLALIIIPIFGIVICINDRSKIANKLLSVIIIVGYVLILPSLMAYYHNTSGNSIFGSEYDSNQINLVLISIPVLLAVVLVVLSIITKQSRLIAVSLLTAIVYILTAVILAGPTISDTINPPVIRDNCIEC